LGTIKYVFSFIHVLDPFLAKILANNPTVACGQVSQSSSTTPYGVKNLGVIVGKRLTWRGFIVFDPNMKAYAKEHVENVSKWIKDGSLKTKESVTVGIDNAAEGFVGMLKGENFGKAVLEIAKA
jgi:NADPH-dependent curcumin reductase CurA